MKPLFLLTILILILCIPASAQWEAPDKGDLYGRDENYYRDSYIDSLKDTDPVYLNYIQEKWDPTDYKWLNKPWLINGKCVIKGNISYKTGEKIYHIPGWKDYDSTVINAEYGERYFCTEWEAYKAGWRAPEYVDRPTLYPNPYK